MERIVSINQKTISKREYQLSLRYWEWANEAMEKKIDRGTIEKLAQQSMIQTVVLEQKAAQMGLAEFTKEEQKTIRARAEYFWNQTLNHYKNQILKEKKAFSELEAFQKAERFLRANGYSIRQLVENSRMEIVYDRMMRTYQKKVEISREEISEEMRRCVEEGAVLNIELMEKVKGNLRAKRAKEMLACDLRRWISQSEIKKEA